MLVGVRWVFPKTVKVAILSWKGSALLWERRGGRFGIWFPYVFFGQFGRKEIT